MPYLLLFMAFLSIFAGILIIQEILRIKGKQYNDSSNKSFNTKQHWKPGSCKATLSLRCNG